MFSKRSKGLKTISTTIKTVVKETQPVICSKNDFMGHIISPEQGKILCELIYECERLSQDMRHDIKLDDNRAVENFFPTFQRALKIEVTK